MVASGATLAGLGSTMPVSESVASRSCSVNSGRPRSQTLEKEPTTRDAHAQCSSLGLKEVGNGMDAFQYDALK